ncbi:DNA-3-methyladenine glycosylase family protein [Nocardia caishijiensis]|uniref:DNA-3-methyladenine glycosylase II n=1 Tax=Nocardia caishijiensis TaxID=184756 RepID=A0ABQ6YUH0_9NOCA|nr:DNA-3-methyladenine glycosylase [Nocardia caishijiensis]KAF0849450.1 3-methyladenine DNA glycosylase/8-oxoguanine DNA glycosylase [Nocardia caishijiensis]
MRDQTLNPESVGLSRTVRSSRPFDVGLTVAPLRRGMGDPCHRTDPDGSHWHASRLPSGPVTYRLSQDGRDGVHARAWGPGAEEFLTGLERMLCLEENVDDFAPEHPKLVEAHRRVPGLRMLRTGLVLESLIPAILEQKVHTKSSFAAYRALVREFGTKAPGPVDLMIAPDADTWRRIPSWKFHRANVGPQRAQTIVRAARVADAIERTAHVDPREAATRLRSIPGIGVWTVAETAQRAFGDADALSVGDYHLAATVGWSLLGRPIDDDAMVAYLEPLRPHRYRAVRLLMLSGQAHKPKFGPRTPVTDHRDH